MSLEATNKLLCSKGSVCCKSKPNKENNVLLSWTPWELRTSLPLGQGSTCSAARDGAFTSGIVPCPSQGSQEQQEGEPQCGGTPQVFPISTDQLNPDSKEYRKKSYCLVGGNTELHCKEDQVKDQQEFLWSFLQLIYHTAPELEATRCRDQPE